MFILKARLSMTMSQISIQVYLDKSFLSCYVLVNTESEGKEVAR